jgi:hypothetical protein
MQTIDPHLVGVAAALIAAVLMVHACIAERQLAWGTRRTNRARRRRP